MSGRQHIKYFQAEQQHESPQNKVWLPCISSDLRNVKSVRHGYLQHPFSLAFVLMLSHCSTAKEPENHGEIFLSHVLPKDSIIKQMENSITFRICPYYKGPHFMNSIVVQLPQLLPCTAILAEVSSQRCSNQLEMGSGCPLIFSAVHFCIQVL